MSLLDADLAFVHYKYGPDLSGQPWLDMQIYKTIRGKWIELKNNELNSKLGKYGK